MKIYSMTATFGKLEHSVLTLQPGLNIIEAPNEWGKSTWCAFLAAMLYGIDTRERTTAAALAVKERYAPWSGAPMSGRIDLCWRGRDITIQRISKGRTPMGEFKAYETASGLAVPELTGENCGQMLVGVEKSVFQRTVFLRLDQMAVTQDEALRRRLNALVTTGDESSQSDDLAQKLRDLKNKVRSNRVNGLIPQALSEKTALEQKLRQLDALQEQTSQCKRRQSQLTEFARQLHNHRAALQYAAARDRAEKSADARRRLAAATAEVEALERICQQLPTEETLMAQAIQARNLRSRKDDLQLELAMLTAPTAPQGLVPHDPEQAKKDFDTYQELSAVTPPKKALLIAAIAALIMALASLVTLFATNRLPFLALTVACIVFCSLCAAAAGICGGLYRRDRRNYSKARQQLQELLGRYAPLPPADWVATADHSALQQQAFASAQAAYDAERTRLQTALQDVCAQLSQLPAIDGHDTALQQRRALQNAKREQATLQHLADTLSATDSTPQMPQEPDSLTYSEQETARLLSDTEAEARQLHKHLGQLEGQMLSLGSREAMQAQLTAVNGRLQRLEQTYAALELAQSTLCQAASELQRRFAPQIAYRASQYLNSLTGGRYDRLQLTDDLSLHTAAAGESASRPGHWRSDGTVDQLYLALRLAVADELTPEAPLVLDDALARFDDTRLAAALALLGRSAQSRQILLFTCQSREQSTMRNGQLTMDN